ncbi:hypothetical protein SESBI_49183, partial [Sesbania bispinosa]
EIDLNASFYRVQEKHPLTSTIAKAIGNMSLFPSIATGESNTPPYGPLRWKASMPNHGLRPFTNPFLIAFR